MKTLNDIIIVYDSLTGMGERFASKLGYPSVSVHKYTPGAAKIIFLTRSINFGRIPDFSADFMEDYHDKVIGICVNGNTNWGSNYGAAGKTLSQQYNIPLILIYEGVGFKKDIQTVLDFINSIN